MAKFIDLCDISGVREYAKLVVGGMSIRPETAQELGFDAGFGPDAPIEAAIDYVEGKPYQAKTQAFSGDKTDLTKGYSHKFFHEEIGALCEEISNQIIRWASDKTSSAIRRARLRLAMEERKEAKENYEDLLKEYVALCDLDIAKVYQTGEAMPHTRRLSREEVQNPNVENDLKVIRLTESQEILDKYNIFVQYGTGCPFMDSYHAAITYAWGTKGNIHFDPSWGARREGLLEGPWTHEQDGTVLSLDNLRLIKRAVPEGKLWQVRAHRGLNTPETVVLGYLAGADLTKINPVYGSLGAGTDPERMMVDSVETIRLAGKFNMPFDVVTNEELCGVPARKAFAGMLVVAALSVRLGAKPILQPLFAYSPEAMVAGYMEDNFVDFNAAKMLALQKIIDAPIWPGAPVGFLTQSQDRCHSATMTALHATLALELGSCAVTIASSDEAYAGGPIAAPSRTDTLKAVAASLRFFGSSKVQVSDKALEMADS